MFSMVSFRRLFGFGRNLLLEGGMEVFYQHSYVLVIGRFFSAELTGLYFLARKISELIPKQIAGAVQQASFPALSTIHNNTDLKLKYRQILQIMMYVISPIVTILVVLSDPIVKFLFSEEWHGIVIYIQLLCVVGWLYPIHAFNVNLLNVKGRSDLVFKIGFVKKAAGILILFLTIPYGVFGIVVGQIVVSVLSIVPNVYFSKSLLDYSIVDQAVDVYKTVISSVVLLVVLYGVLCFIDVSEWWFILLSGLAGSVLYVLVSFVIKDPCFRVVFSKFVNC